MKRLKHTILGQRQVQGIDYAYTLQGWLKGVNSTSVGDGSHDMGGGGTLTARDAYGFSLHYFTGDYQAINASVSPFAGFSGLFPAGHSYKPLYNGNISAMVVNIGKLDNPILYNYQYDQLNRLVAMDAFSGLDESNNSWNTLSTDNSYRERISYDGNGNILTYKRNGDAARQAMDSLTYHYQPGTNKLDKVTDAAPDVASGEYDKYNDIKQGQQTGNYQYDAIGNLISDVSEGITNIEWTVYGKIKSITKTGGVNISYSYDAAGNRISKNVNGKETWYVRDASGNVMSVYSKDATENSGHLTQSEVHLYAGARLGILNTGIDMEMPPVEDSIVTFKTSYKYYELTNHLGNVLATISDRKLSHSTDGTHIDYYTADVVSANDYYPFGMMMPGRIFSSGKEYRYSINGQEKTPEIAPNTTTAEFWQYDSRIGRRWNVDPRPEIGLSEYSVLKNDPIWYNDVLGDTSSPVVSSFKAIVSTSLPGLGTPVNLIPENKTGEKIVGSALGAGEAIQDFGGGTYIMFRHPIKTISGIAKMGTIGGQTDPAVSVATNYVQSASEFGDGFTNVRYTSYLLTSMGLTFAGTEGANFVGGSVTALNRFAATRYLTATGDISAFRRVEGFSLRFGRRDFVYHNSLGGAGHSRWSTPTSFSSSRQAINDLALGYPGSQNTAMIRYKLRNFGLYVKGTAERQGSTLGGGTQLLRTPFSLRSPTRWSEFIHFK